MEKLVYRVYEGEIIPEGEKFVFCVSSLREISLREEIRNGEITKRKFTNESKGRYGK